jgi:hypothetical protein
MFKNLVKNRPDTINVNAALCEEEKLLHYTDSSANLKTHPKVQKKLLPVELAAVNGFIEFMSPEFLQQWHADATNKLEELPTLSCLPMKQLAPILGIRQVDIWVLDVEGAEYAVLKGTDWDNFHASTILMECTSGKRKEHTVDDDKINFLTARGYNCRQTGRNCFCRHSSFNRSKAPPEHPTQYAHLSWRAQRHWLNMNKDPTRDPRKHPQFLSYIPKI